MYAGITVPSGERQAQLLEEVYREAGVDPAQVVYVETHGTGTKVGDPQEANAICEVFCRERTPEQMPLLIGSVRLPSILSMQCIRLMRALCR